MSDLYDRIVNNEIKMKVCHRKPSTCQIFK